MASKNNKFIKNIVDFVDSIEAYKAIIEDPELARYIAHEIAKVAVREAKFNVLNGGTDKGRRRHSRNTEHMTETFSKGARQTRDVLYESGSLYNAIKIVASTVAFGRVIVEVGIKDPKLAKIAELNEFGDRISNSPIIDIPARPFLLPAVEEAAQLTFATTLLNKAIHDAVSAKMNGKDWRKAFRSVMPSK
jgi:hypothetical protein